MEKNEFKIFCKHEFEARGFQKQRNVFYLLGHDLMCGIDLQKSNYGDVYYVNFYYFIGEYSVLDFPSPYNSDVEERIIVMSKTQTVRGKCFLTAMIEYKEYTEEELRPYFEKEFNERILPPVHQGKKYILDNLGKLYSLTLNREEVLQKLKS